MKNKTKGERWESIIAEWEESGRTQKEFCFEKGISRNTFHYHRKKLKQKKQKFVEVRRVEIPAKEIEILLTKGEVRITLQSDFCEQTLARVLRIVGVHTYVC